MTRSQSAAAVLEKRRHTWVIYIAHPAAALLTFLVVLENHFHPYRGDPLAGSLTGSEAVASAVGIYLFQSAGFLVLGALGSFGLQRITARRAPAPTPPRPWPYQLPPQYRAAGDGTERAARPQFGPPSRTDMPDRTRDLRQEPGGTVGAPPSILPGQPPVTDGWPTADVQQSNPAQPPTPVAGAQRDLGSHSPRNLREQTTRNEAGLALGIVTGLASIIQGFDAHNVRKTVVALAVGGIGAVTIYLIAGWRS